MRLRSSFLIIAACLLAPVPASAATTIGSDLSATPTASCHDGGANISWDCSLTQLGDAASTAPAGGVIVRWSYRHGPNPAGASIPYASLRVLKPGGDAQTFTTSPLGNVGPSADAGVDTFTANPGIPVAAGDRIGVYVHDASLAVLAAGAGQAGWVRGSANGTQTYAPVAGQLLLQAVIEPDADGDGYGDETQDACPTVSGPGACPAPAPTDPGTAPATPTTPPSSGTGGDIPIFTAPGIEAFQAEPIGVYHAATIKRLPATTNLYDAVMKGWSQPIRCSLACQITTAATMRGISASLYAMMARTRTVTVAKASGSFPTAGRGKLPIKLTAKARRALKRYGRTVKLTLRTTVRDGRGKPVTRRQTITLKAKPKKRRHR